MMGRFRYRREINAMLLLISLVAMTTMLKSTKKELTMSTNQSWKTTPITNIIPIYSQNNSSYHIIGVNTMEQKTTTIIPQQGSNLIENMTITEPEKNTVKQQREIDVMATMTTQSNNKDNYSRMSAWSESDWTQWYDKMNETFNREMKGRKAIMKGCYMGANPKECFMKNNLFWPNKTQVSRVETPMLDGCKNSRRMLILHSYERTGSTYFGRLFKDHPGIFYLFEPYRQLEMIYKIMKYPRTNQPEPDMVRKEEKTLMDYRNCELQNLIAFTDKILTTGVNGYYVSSNMHPFFDCIKAYHNMQHDNMTRSAHYRLCINIAKNICEDETKTKVLLTKTVRGTMEGVASFLANQKCTNNIKVIHLVRDPRAMFNSWYSASWSGLKNLSRELLQEKVHQMCSRIFKDIIIRKDLERIYPDMFMQVRYEDLAKYTHKTMIDMFTFLGERMRYSDLSGMTGRGSNASHPYKYPQSGVMQLNLTNRIDELCYPFYIEAGYIPVTDKILTWMDAYHLVVQNENENNFYLM
ncbi:unnamed protein product [Owenia fusiformis]|uniref:Uncharacterized protein n=1 Tax=Owenia fusiformis TaxID=6347 RepID=A0A8S4PDF8_OWEFU|nr:unnamed protein product [Owenia fusiformis]